MCDRNNIMLRIDHQIGKMTTQCEIITSIMIFTRTLMFQNVILAAYDAFEHALHHWTLAPNLEYL